MVELIYLAANNPASGIVHLHQFPSVWAESSGLVAARAVAAGIPFVISDAGDLPQVAGTDHSWVVREHAPAAARERVRRLLENLGEA